MKIFVLGAGAIGSLLGARLSKKNDVLLYSLDTKHMEQIKHHGLNIEELDGKVTNYKLDVITDINELKFYPDLVLITLKSYTTQKGVLAVRNILGKDAIYLTLQNGIGNVETLLNIIDRHRIIAGITAQGATLVKEGYVRHGGNGPTYIGEVEGEATERIYDIVKNFNDCGLQCFATDETEKLIWKKLIINIGINAITAIVRVKNGCVAESKWAKDISKMAVIEAVKIAKAKGIEFPHNIFDEVIEVAKRTSKNISSMHQDILNHNPTEIDAINGAIVRYGEKYNIDVPVNKTLTNLIKLIEEDVNE